MIRIRKSSDRGHFDHGWLNSYHTFSFGNYFDRNFISFGTLRVINEDVVAPDTGFDTHAHKDMEIFTYVISGELEHRDSLGSQSILKAGEVQFMSAGSGITHSEKNPSSHTPVHLYQIWIMPEEKGIKPRYLERSLSDTNDGLKLLADPAGGEDIFAINQQAKIYFGNFKGNTTFQLPLFYSRAGWLQLVSGSLSIENHSVNPGDGVSFSEEDSPEVTIQAKTKFLLFDLPAV
jgi:redox-sensitive bicupin YhaK (pirin superfamily)